MKFLSLLLGLIAPLLAFCQVITEEDGVLVLGAENFDHAISTHNNILVEFYAPWCGHCKSLAPEYAKAATALKDAPVKLAKVDATVHDSLGKKFDVKGFPTLKFFKGGKVSDYTGGRTEKDIVTWLQKKVGPAYHQISSESDLENFQESHDAFAVGVFSSLDSEEAKNFIAAADSDDTHTYAVSSDSSVKNKLGVSDNTVVVLKSFDDLRNDFSVSGQSADEIVKFVSKKTTPLIQEFSPETSKQIFSSPITKHVLFFTNKNKEHHQAVKDTFKEAAKQFEGQLLFVNVPNTEVKVLQYFEIAPDQVPATIVADLGAESGILKFPFTGDHTNVDTIKTFLTDFLDGKLTPHLKSEDVEEDDTTGNVVVLRGKSFSDLVLNNDKDVLVEFYAPWCGHCKQLAPTWEELGKTYKDHKDKVTIAKIDATANEVNVPGVSVRGFPSIVFFKGNDKANPIKYEEKRELSSFIEFIQKNAHNKVSVAAAQEEEEEEGNDEL